MLRDPKGNKLDGKTDKMGCLWENENHEMSLERKKENGRQSDWGKTIEKIGIKKIEITN